MQQEKWLESVYSDGSSFFVSNPQPEFGETVTVKLRVYADAPVRHAILRSVHNGVGYTQEMTRGEVSHGLAYYSAELKMSQSHVHYHFYLICDGAVYYYTQRGITTYVPDYTYDFSLLTDYRQPSWVKKSVFYQIFPERFCNGDPTNDVQDGEYSLNGYSTIQMKDWNALPLLYEKGHCMEFFGGDLQGVKEKIPYFKELGINAIYLNPIFAAPSAHKYDCIDYFHVDPHFGGDEALADLCQALHENGMKIILDISINHTGTAHKWFNKDGVYFDKSLGAYNNPESEERNYYFFEEGSNEYHGWMGVQELPTLNYTSQELRKIIYEDENSVIRKWLKPPYCIDGWRFDVADTFARKDALQLADEIWPQLRNCIREENPDAYILAEDWADCAQYLQGTEWDSPMNYFGCARVLREFAGVGDPYGAMQEIRNAAHYQMTAEDVEARVMQHLAKIPFALWQNQFNLVDSHDAPRLHNYPEINMEHYRGVAILQYMLIGTPSLYYGDEALVQGWVTDNDGCRATFPWDSDYRSLDVWQMYQKLSHLKLQEQALIEGGQKFLYAANQIVALARFTDEKAYVAVMSTAEEDQNISLPLGAIGAKGAVDTVDIFGTPLEITPVGDGKCVSMTVKAHGAYLFECTMC